MTIQARPTCRACRKPLISDARFCSACGEPTARLIAEKRHSARLSNRLAQRAILSVSIGFVGTLAALIAVSLLVTDGPRLDAEVFIWGLSLQVMVGVLAACPLGPRLALTVLRPLGKPRDYLDSIPVAAVALAFSLVWVNLVNHWTGSSTEATEVDLWLYLDVILVAPLIEEWLCRGVVWRATREVASRNITLLITASLFALLHFLNGGTFLELPHRFVAGLLFGILRYRSGSIWPGVLAHILLNLAAILA